MLEGISIEVKLVFISGSLGSLGELSLDQLLELQAESVDLLHAFELNLVLVAEGFHPLIVALCLLTCLC